MFISMIGAYLMCTVLNIENKVICVKRRVVKPTVLSIYIETNHLSDLYYYFQ